VLFDEATAWEAQTENAKKGGTAGDCMTKRTATLLVGVVLIVSVLAAGCTFNVGTTSPSPSPTNTYTSTKGFSIKYPSDWTKEANQSGALDVLFVLPTNNAAENLNVQVINTTDTLSNRTANILGQVQDLPDFSRIEAGNATLAGNPAYKVVYTATIDGNKFKLTQIWTVKNGKEYFITYKAAPNNYDQYAGTAQQMIDSFQIS
jgi:hypothetical protein